MLESCCSRLWGQDQGKVQHQQSILQQQRGKKRRVQTFQIGKMAFWCESVLWRSPESPLHPQFVLCPLETGSDQGGVLHRPCPPGDQAEMHGSTETKTTTLRFHFFKSEEVEEWRNVVGGRIQNHLTINVKPKLWREKKKKTSVKLDYMISSSLCQLQV